MCASEKPRKRPIILGISGGTASGKTYVCNKIINYFKKHQTRVLELSMDRFYIGLNEEELKTVKSYNFDQPDAFDWPEFSKTLQSLRNGEETEVPVYSFVKHQREEVREKMEPADVIIVEGILVFHSAEIRKHMDVKLFVDADADLRLARRLQRDVRERGRTVESVLDQYQATVKPSFEQWILPTKTYADIVIPGVKNKRAVTLIIHHIEFLTQGKVTYDENTNNNDSNKSKL